MGSDNASDSTKRSDAHPHRWIALRARARVLIRVLVFVHGIASNQRNPGQSDGSASTIGHVLGGCSGCKTSDGSPNVSTTEVPQVSASGRSTTGPRPHGRRLAWECESTEHESA
jgi:hypothetical protein